jgi:hypothetical protein
MADHPDTILTKEIALRYCSCGEWPDGTAIDSGDYTSITDDAAAVFSDHQEDLLGLDGLKRLSLEAARALSASKSSLSLSGLESLEVDVARALANHKRSMELNGLKNLPPDIALALSAHGTRSSYLSLNGLVALSPESAYALSKYCGGRLDLNGLRSVSDATAVALSKYKGLMNLDGAISLTEVASKALSKHVEKGSSQDLKTFAGTETAAISTSSPENHLAVGIISEDDLAKAKELHKQGDVIGALKMVRTITGMELSEARKLFS